MKSKLYALFAALALLSTKSVAQTGHIWDLRLYGGINVLQLTSDEGSTIINGVVHNRSVSGRPGYQVGVGLTFGNRFFIKPGVQFSGISTKIVNKNTVTGTELTDAATIQTLSIPLRVGFRLIDPTKENLFNVRLFGGIVGSHVMSVKQGENSTSTTDITRDDYQNLIMSADFGLGVDLWIFYAEAGYQLGLSPVHTGGDNAKANAFYANFGLRFTFGK